MRFLNTYLGSARLGLGYAYLWAISLVLVDSMSVTYLDRENNDKENNK